jgi:FHS family L-fucose permease-like MFS transporter
MSTNTAKAGVVGNTRLLWIMFASYFTFGIVLNVVGVMIPVLIRQYHLSLFVGGLLAFALYIPFGVCSIPAGLAADRFGPKPVVLFGVFLMAAGCVAIMLVEGFVSITLSAFVIGAGIALLETAGNPLIEHLDRRENYHRNLTLTIGFCGIGAFAGPFCLSALQAHGLPWQWLYAGYAVLCFVLLLALAFSDFPEREAATAAKLRPREIASLLSHPVAVTYFLGIFFYVGAEVGTASWIVRFFQQVHGLSAIRSAGLGDGLLMRNLPALPVLTVSLFWGLQGLGRLTSGPGIKMLGARSVLRLYALGATCCLLLAVFGPVSVTAVGFAACGFFTSVLFTLLFSGAVNTFLESQGTLSGLLVTASIGGAVIPPLVGLTADHLGIRIAMMIPLLCFLYVLAISLVGRAKYD